MPFNRAVLEKDGQGYNNELFVSLSSMNDGHTWQEVGQRVPGREARLQLLKDGTITTTCHLLERDIANDAGLTLMGFMRSQDRGRTWQRQWISVRDLQPEARDITISRNVLEMPDGSILTAYTTRRYLGNRDITDELFSEAVRWNLDDTQT